MIQIKKRILDPMNHNRPAYSMKPVGLLYHTTNNWSKSAGDEMHAGYMETTSRVVSWHVTVDHDSATQHIPYNENAWHAGDGAKGFYNRNWLGLEIACNKINKGEPIDPETYDNAVDVAAQMMMETGVSQLAPHKIVYGKDCPHHSFFDHKTFEKDVQRTIQIRSHVQMDWKEKIMLRAMDDGLITQNHKADDPAPKWFVLQVIHNAMNGRK
jgi:N-acetylmuramoyl-L-alanine amidase